MSSREQLAEIVGVENITDNPEILRAYSEDHSFVASGRPQRVVRPHSTLEVQEIVKWANKFITPLVSVSSGMPHFRGHTVPSTGDAIIVDLSAMKKIMMIDRRNRVAMFEPGLTFSELMPVLEKEGLGLYMPLVPRGSKSVLGSYLEREPITMPRHHWDMQAFRSEFNKHILWDDPSGRVLMETFGQQKAELFYDRLIYL